MSAVAAPELVARPHAVPTRSVLRPLALVEARRLLLHPLTAIGLVLSALFVYQMADQTVGGSYMVLMGAAVYPLACTTMIAANAATLRSRRDRTAELYGTLPAPRTVHTLALALALLAPTVLGVLAIAVTATWYGAWDGVPYDLLEQTIRPDPADLAAGPLGILALGALGICLGRWVPTVAASVFTVVALTVASIPLVTWNVDSPWRWAAPFVNSAESANGGWPCDASDVTWCPTSLSFETTGMRWHALGLVAVSALLVGLALLADRRAARR